MTDTISVHQTDDITLALQYLERFGTFGDLELATPAAVERFAATQNPDVTARALATVSRAHVDDATMQAIADRIAEAPDALAIAMDLARKAELDPLSVFLISSILKKLAIISPIATIQSVPVAVLSVYDALIEDEHVHFFHDGRLSGTSFLVVDLADPVTNCASTKVNISAATARFPVADMAWLQHARVACPAFVIIATA